MPGTRWITTTTEGRTTGDERIARQANPSQGKANGTHNDPKGTAMGYWQTALEQLAIGTLGSLIAASLVALMSKVAKVLKKGRIGE